MGAITYDIEIPSSIPAAKMFKAVVLDADTLIPKVMPQAIKSVEILEGDVYTIVEGDALAGVLESITYHVKIVPTEDGGCICKNRSIYHTKGDVEINEEKIKEGKEKAMQMFKAIEAYLQANA
ncbi:UNVERIFIED_CONTAM: Major allergen Pru ar 1 [Sesamum angustifolium]|uniref:Major allergen Pru ar 1 n=1 Tax=Sesamum angustifolium TaxID=2727405 RepID=A0AAW2RNP8_9LAMI